MGRRPLCLVCLLLILVMCLADWMGIPIINGDSLSESVQTWIASRPEITICGEVYQCQNTEFSHSVYLKNIYLKEVSLTDLSEISIENIRVFLKEKEEVPIGAIVCVSGKLEEIEETRNPGEFDAKQYYACQHVSCFLKDGKIEAMDTQNVGYRQRLEEIRKKFASIFKMISGEDAPIFEAMLLGKKSELDEEVKIRYQMSGIVHILSISGTHISILGMGLFAFLKLCGAGNLLAGFVSVFLMLQYGLLTGGSVSAMRAVCMFTLAIGAQILGRSYDMLTVLALSAIVLLLDAPAYLHSSGFLLSFGAVAGLGVLTPVLYKILEVKNKFAKTFWASVAVQVITLPVVLWAYGEISLIGIVLNLLVLPTVSGILVSGVVGGLLGLFWSTGAQFAVLPGRWLLSVYEWLCEVGGHIPFCTWVGGQPGFWQTVGYYVFVGGWFSLWYWYKNIKKETARGSKGRKTSKKIVWGTEKSLRILFVMVPILIGCTVLGYREVKGLKITALDVGQGMAMVLETPENHHVLIDGGSSNKNNVGQYQILPYLKSQGISRLEAMIVSHTDNDHISGIQEMLEFQKEHLSSVKTEKLILPEWEKPPEAYEKLLELAGEAGVKVLKAKAGDVLVLDDIRIKILAPAENVEKEAEISRNGASLPDDIRYETDANENGLVLQVEYGDFQGLFTGDIGMKTEEKLIGQVGEVDYLQVAHHGSRFSSGELFLQKVQPKIGVISCSAANTYGHPSAETVKRLEKLGCHVEYTMKNGAITVWTDGEQIAVNRWINS